MTPNPEPGRGPGERRLARDPGSRSGQVPDPADDGTTGDRSADEGPSAPEGAPAPQGASGEGDAEAGVPDGADGLLADAAGLMAERNEYLVALQRLQADFENYRKRVQRQQEEQSTRATANVVSKLLPVLDTLDLAELHLGAAPGADQSDEVKALLATRNLLLEALEKEGLERVDRAGVRFDPVVHDAVAHVPLDEAAPAPPQGGSDGAPDGAADESPGTGEATGDPQRADAPDDERAIDGARDAAKVDEVFRAGYRWHGQVLRPAMVRVKG